MNSTKKISALLVLALCMASAFLLAGCILGRWKVSRVPIPGSPMTAVVTADLSGCYSVQLFEHGHPISDLQLLGPFVSEHCSLTQVSRTSNIVTIDWTDEGNHYQTAVDVAARRFVIHSNGVPVP